MKTLKSLALLSLGLVLWQANASENFAALYNKAKNRSYSLKAEYSRLKASDDGVAIAKARLYPSLNFSSSLNSSKTLSPSAGPTSLNLNNSLRVEQVLFDRHVYYSIKLSKLDAQKNQLQYQDEERKFAISFAQLYITVLTHRVEYLLLKKQYEIIDELVSQAHDQGAGDDIKEALWTRLDPLALSVIQAKTIFENSAAKLKAICGLEDLERVFYADDSYNFISNKALGQSKLLEKVLRQALQYNYDVRMSTLNSQSEYKKYEMERLPPISLRAYAGVANHQMNMNQQSNHENEFSTGLVFSLNWDFGRKKRREQQEKLHQASVETIKDVKEAVRGMLGDTVNNLFAGYASFERLNAIDKRYHATKSRVQIAKEGLDDIVSNFSTYSKDIGLTNSKLSALGSYINTVLQDKQIKQSILVEELNIIQITGKLNIQGVIKEIDGILKDSYPLETYEI
jgi:outer membrane protein TolC